MLYSKSSEYAIQAMLYLAEREGQGLSMVSSIAEANGIPRHFLAKLVQPLTRSRLATSSASMQIRRTPCATSATSSSAYDRAIRPNFVV